VQTVVELGREDMKIRVKSARFVYSRTQFEDTEQVEICMVGRSNAGKSSLINMLVGQNGLAKSSSTPGRTRLINYFEVGLTSDDGSVKSIMLVDLPGYGYAQASKSSRELWDGMIDNYLDNSTTLKMCLLLVDSRHDVMTSDKQASQYLYAKQIPFAILGAKSDKLPKSQVAASTTRLASGLKVGQDNIIMTSATTGLGRERLLDVLWMCSEMQNIATQI
jgi:GTP-binding protein